MKTSKVISRHRFILGAVLVAAFLWTPGVEGTVNLTLYYEGLCHGCHHFILEQLWPTYAKLEEYLNLDLLPFGFARMKVSNGTVTFHCQHGPDECYVNEVQTCAVKYVHPTKKLLDFVACMLRQKDPAKAGQPCAQKVSTDWGVLDRCSRGPEGTQLLYEMGKRTQGHKAPILYVPYVEINGYHNETVQVFVNHDLFHYVCKLLEPESPKVCTKMETDDRCFTW
ncbi:hypothetical protein HPB48_010016 [Haemaphysalis longicornis]|uniref:Gamma-interferon inducible lysosomal thiol reductase n=1 Tax=Haemaphysalis longicornis TaxID=44386 RepID=A0A9J6GDY3_HAELO|nr:hypothetical protein HPB48_010016 [Haemaphysalis longicornis]